MINSLSQTIANFTPKTDTTNLNSTEIAPKLSIFIPAERAYNNTPERLFIKK